MSGGFWAPDGAYSRFVSPIIGLVWVAGREPGPLDPESCYACRMVIARQETLLFRRRGNTLMAVAAQPKPSAWSPFRYRAFTVLWTAMLLSNVGGWMHDVGAGWLMTTLNPSPLMVSLVQAATTLPVFLLALPAGALADIVDRRGCCSIAKIYMALSSRRRSASSCSRASITPAALLAFTLAMGGAPR